MEDDHHQEGPGRGNLKIVVYFQSNKKRQEPRDGQCHDGTIMNMKSGESQT